MNENVSAEVTIYGEQESAFKKEISAIEVQAGAIVITDDETYAVAAQYARNVKGMQKKVEEYWEPMRESTYNAYNTVLSHKKAMVDPLKSAESIIKKKMSAYLAEKERKKKEEEERLRRLAQQEAERKLAEALKAEEEGDAESADYAMAEAEVMDDLSRNMTSKQADQKVSGVTKSKSWAIKNIDLSKLPDTFNGVLLRPADERAIMTLIKATKGQIVIPGVEYEETVNVSLRAS